MTMTLWTVCAVLVDINDDDTTWGLCVQEWFDELDTNDDDKVTKQEFMNALMKLPSSEVK